jgi:hypothetical protein
MSEHADRSRRWDTNVESGDSDAVEPTEATESEEAIVGVQPGTEADVPFNDVPDEADDEEASTNGAD